MKNTLLITINDETVAEFDKGCRLPGRQREFLMKMEQDMKQGITLGDCEISEPDQKQCAHYVAMHLLNAIIEGNHGMQIATSAYLVSRMPGLQQVKAVQQGDTLSIELISVG